MKKLNKLILVLFSILILIQSIAVCLIIIGLLDFSVVANLLNRTLSLEPSNQIIFIITIIFIALSIKCIFFDSSSKSATGKQREVLMQNESGRLIISIDTLENLANSVVKGFMGAKEVSTKIQLDSENNVIVLVNLLVTKDVVIKELTLNIQNKIKEAIKSSSDLEVKEVNVRIKNIVSPEENQNV